MNCLSLGAAGKGPADWTNLDADPANGPDIVARVPPLPDEVKHTVWDRIEMIHFIEHLHQWEADELLEQLYGVLRPGGLLVLEQPNIEYCARVLLGLESAPPGPASAFGLWGFYGDPRSQNPLMTHRWGYTPQSLEEALVKAGFERERIVHGPARQHSALRDFRIEAVK